MTLSIAAKFNIVFLSIFILGFGAATYITNHLVQQNAREETLQNARVLMQSALAARGYTVGQIVPLLETRLKYEFMPQSIPSYAATEQLSQLLKQYPDFTYKEATLNPTNPRDRAADWEADLVNTFRAKPDLTELVGERNTATGPALYVARPLQVKNVACLRCHSVPDAAPRAMLAIYGRNNGFGWKHMEIVGAQVASVPMEVPLQRAGAMLRTYMLSMLGIFVLLFIALNVMVHVFITQRITRMSRLADQVSLGQFNDEEFDVKGGDELSTLARSFARMRSSLASAMKMLDE
ncbi:c-type heme family protein [Massilia sp. LjRoot122]|uniref:Tll0287-like domain-containing protein n=1 Tax=Massilia sp. LjRoot122 TaxID=3342257 RepID=UPI003ECC7F78